jgi:hypothetical protein
MTTVTLVSVLLSLALEWFPGLKDWWEPLTEGQKRGLIAAAVAVFSLAGLGINCGYYDVCPTDWLAAVKEVALTFVVAAAGVSGVYVLAKRTTA